MARPSKHDGVVYRRKESKIWWMRYRDRSGCRRLESTHTEDWQEAQRQLRERLQARDNNTLHIVRKGEQLAFSEWADFSWRTIPSRRFAQPRHTKRMRVRSRVFDRCSDR